MLAAMLVGAKIAGELAERIGQPAVLGELVAGVLLGPSVLGVVDPAQPTVALLAEIGVILLLFSIGLETELDRLLRVGAAASAVAVVGVVLPFALGTAAMLGLGRGTLPAIVCGAALTATSVGITARVLSDLGRLHETEGQVILGAAVIDDVIGLIILATVGDLVAGEALTATGIGIAVAAAFGFIAATLIVGRFTIPPLFAFLGRLGREELLATMGLALAFLLAVLAERAGSALIIGAFSAGLVLAPTPQAHTIDVGARHLGRFFVPIFFVHVGAMVDVRAFADPAVLVLGLVLTVAAVVGKVAAGWAPVWMQARKLVIGVGMVPRGEVGLIFAQLGATAGVLDAGTFSALMMMVMITTFLAPPLLRRILARGDAQGGTREDAGGVAEMTTEA
jgi:Kef-type K+ transport system membrane component KefB